MTYKIDGNLINLSKIDSVGEIYMECKLGLPKSFVFFISGKDYIVTREDKHEINKIRRDLVMAWKQEVLK